MSDHAPGGGRSGGDIAAGRQTHVDPVPADELAAYLDSRTPPDALDPIARAAITRWQGPDRFYERVQRVIREGTDDYEATLTATVLEDLIDRCEIGRTVICWRGERDSNRVFGVSAGDLANLVGRAFDTVGFYAVSASRDVAEGAFTIPGRDPVIVRAVITPNAHALWVAAAGAPELAEQQELLLFSPTVDIVKVTFSDNGRAPVIDVEIRK